MSYIISEDGKELLKDVRDFCVNEVKEQVKEYDIPVSGQKRFTIRRSRCSFT